MTTTLTLYELSLARCVVGNRLAGLVPGVAPEGLARQDLLALREKLDLMMREMAAEELATRPRTLE